MPFQTYPDSKVLQDDPSPIQVPDASLALTAPRRGVLESQHSAKTPMRLSFLALMLFLYAPPPLRAEQGVVAPKEKCTVEGLVVDGTTGLPLKRAHVTLRRADGRRGRYGATTDASGRFTLKDVEPGRYRLMAEREGYVRQDYGQQSFRRAGTILALEPGQHLRDIVLRLSLAGVITGRVYDEDGQPTREVRVQALRNRYVSGQRQLVPTKGTQTNDLGEYRLYGLDPGQYHVVATPKSKRIGRDAGNAQAEVGKSETPGEVTYAPVYYPGTHDPRSSTPLQIWPGDEVRAIDFTLLPTRTVRLSGRVLNALSGEPVRGAMVWLTPREAGVHGSFFRKQTRVKDAQGAFVIRGVTPGSYTLYAHWFDKGKIYATRESLDFGATDIEDVRLSLHPGASLDGRIRVEGDEPLTFTGLRVVLQPLEEAPTGYPRAPVKAQGTFVLPHVTPGSYRVVLSNAPADFYLKAARLGGADVLEAGLSLSAGQRPGLLELVVSPAGGRVEGVVEHEEKAFSAARVVLVPELQRRDQIHLYKTAITDQQGRFRLRAIPPGDYKLFAWEEVETGAYHDPEFLRKYEGRGESIRVREGERNVVQLKLIPAEEGRR